MPLNSLGRRSSATVIAALLIAGGCTSAGNDKPLAPTHVASAPSLAAGAETEIPVGVVISQVYGGGGNVGATLTNDFIELYNGTIAPVSIDGWSVQYASTKGTTWQVTPIAGTLAPGQYYLVQEAKGNGGTVSLPDADAIGGIPMAAGAGKVALVGDTTKLSGGCPTNVVDFVGFGTGTDCFEGTGPTPTISATVAALRKGSGLQDTDDNKADFATGAPAPRNTSSPAQPPVPTLTVQIAPAAPSAVVGSGVTFTASAKFGGVPVAINSATWASSNSAVATIDPMSTAMERSISPSVPTAARRRRPPS